MLSRRAFLYTGGAGLVVLGTGITGSILTKNIDPVVAPWRNAAKGFGDPRLDALAYAILAPSPHNRQPWMVRLDDNNRLTIFCDLTRLLPETDPPNRQIVIGFGAFIELLRQAAAEGGHRLEINAFPEGEPEPVLDERPIAQIAFIKDSKVERDPLFGQALFRRTSRVPYDMTRPVSIETLNQISTLAAAELPTGTVSFDATLDQAMVTKLKKICRDSWEIEANTKSTLMESVKLTRIGAAEVNVNPDGISLYGPRMEALKMLGMVNREGMAQQGSAGHQATLDYYNGLIDATSAMGWISTPSNSRLDQLRAGSMWLRLNLAGTQLGLGMHPLSQVLQEFPEMESLYADFHRKVSVESPNRVQGLFRFGYAGMPGPSPRWSLESRLVTA